MRKRIFATLIMLWTATANAGFVHPMDFDGSEAKKKEVIEYIKHTVHRDYCESGLDMCNETTLRMMEQENLSAFKQATTAKNRKIMDRVVKDYCHSGINMCNYAIINMMYIENVNASGQELSW